MPSARSDRKERGRDGGHLPGLEIPGHTHRSAAVMESLATPAKPRKRLAAKSSSRSDEAQTKLTLYVPADLAKRFAVHATYSDMDRSELFAAMIREHCRRFVVSDRAKSPGDSPEEVSA